jgi:hypothetical protein
MPTDGPARPHPKPAPRPRKYRRKVASAKQWAAIAREKQGPCRVCCDPCRNGGAFPAVQLHHVVPRGSPWFGDDLAENIVPLCLECHGWVTMRLWGAGRAVVETLTDAEYAYAVERGGESFFERCYGLRYTRP